MSENDDAVKDTNEADPHTVPLRVKVKAHGEEINKLTFRTPKGQDISASGMPFTMNEKGETDIKPPAMSALMSRLSGVPLSTIGNLEIDDWMRCCGMVMDFFGGPASDRPKN